MVELNLILVIEELRREASNQILQDPLLAYRKLEEANKLVRKIVELG